MYQSSSTDRSLAEHAPTATSVKIARRVLPLRARNLIRDSPILKRPLIALQAKGLATSTKRLDLCAADLAHAFHLAGVTGVEEKDCLEIGSGWVLTHSIVLHLMGARSVTATDVDAIARFRALGTAVRRAQPGPIEDFLAPFSSYSAVRERLSRVRSIGRFSQETLRNLGVRYIAPIDLSHATLPGQYDFIYSRSVLEHIPLDDVAAVLATLASALRPGGQMLHAVHLEDHRNFIDDPWAFLGVPSAEWDRTAQTAFGNRLRASQWRHTFRETAGLESQISWSWSRYDRPLPPQIESSIGVTDPNDLQVGGILIHSTKV